MNIFSGNPWDNIENISPDEIDLKLLDEIKSDPDCHDFISSEQLKKELGL